MSNVLPFKKVSAAKRFKGRSLCRDGFHKWRVENERKFDVKQGKLVTVLRCERCQKVQHRLL